MCSLSFHVRAANNAQRSAGSAGLRPAGPGDTAEDRERSVSVAARRPVSGRARRPDQHDVVGQSDNTLVNGAGCK